MNQQTFNYLELDDMEKLRFRDEILRSYYPYLRPGIGGIRQLIEIDRNHYIEQQNYEMAQAYQDLINDLKLFDKLAH